MSEDLQSVKNRLDQHEREIGQIGLSTNQMIDGQKGLTESLTDLTISLNRYIDRHEATAQQIADLKAEQREMTKAIISIQNVNAGNQPVLDGVKSLNAKLVWFVLAAILTPIISAGFIATRVGGGG